MNRNERAGRVLAGLILSPCLMFIGIAAGATIAGMSRSGMGWDQLADAIGGMIVGSVLGLAFALYFATRLPVPRLRAATIGSALAALLVWGMLFVRARKRADLRGAGKPPTAMTSDPKPTTPAEPTRPVHDAAATTPDPDSLRLR